MPSDDEAWLDLDEPDLDELIEQITVDAHGDEGYWSFRQAFEDHIHFPVAASAIGDTVAVTEVDFDSDERRGLTATVQHPDRTGSWTISLLDVHIGDGHPSFALLVGAYRRWLGTGT